MDDFTPLATALERKEALPPMVLPRPLPPIDDAVDCETCSDARYVILSVPMSDPRFGKGQPCPKCGTVKADVSKEIPEHFRTATFASFQVKRNPAMKEAYELCQAVAEGQERAAFLIGLSGLGKTHLAWAAYRRWRERRLPATFWQVPSLLADMRKWMFDEEGAANHMEQEMARLADPARLLILDDMGKAKSTEWSEQQLYLICDMRYARNGPTILTANVNPKTLDNEIAPAIRDRFAAAVIECKGRSQRGKAKR